MPAALTAIGEQLGRLKEIQHLPPYEQGKAIGSLLVALISLELLGKGAISLVSKLGKGGKALFATIKELTVEVETSSLPVLASPVRATYGTRGRTYHYDYELYTTDDSNPHNMLPHLQFHTDDGIIRIFC